MRGVLITFAILLGASFQAALPTFRWLGDIKPELLPALVAYVALSINRPAAVLLLASLAGLAHDALSAAPFGMTMATFGVAALVLCWFQDLLDRGLPWVQLAAGAFVSLLTGFVAVLTVGVTLVALVKLIWLGVLNAIVTVVIFFLIDYVRLQLGWET